MTILSLVGARPNLVKAAPVVRCLASRSDVQHVLVHTGQHSSLEMSDQIASDLDLPRPAVHLGIGGGSHAQNTGRMMIALEPVLTDVAPDLVVVFGDVDSTVAGALTAAKLQLTIAHVEAGLRSFNRRMPEEVNRVVTDHLATLLFCSEPSGVENLQREGVSAERIHLVGNVMIDSLWWALDRVRSSSQVLERFGLQPQSYAVVTLHRPENVDDRLHLARVLEGLAAVAAEIPLLWPVHPRTSSRLRSSGLEEQAMAIRGLTMIGALGYLDFIKLMADSRLVLTDSGGIQEETTALGIPCLTLREETERPITVIEGTNLVVGTSPQRVHRAAVAALTVGREPRRPVLWDGHAADRIVDVMLTCPG